MEAAKISRVTTRPLGHADVRRGGLICNAAARSVAEI
jgi:hypothetical protein